MKKRVLLFAFSIIFISTLEAKFVITPTISKELSTPSKDFQDDQVLLGLGLRGDLNKNYALDFKLSSSTDNLMGDGGKTDIERGSINLYYETYPEYKVSPFFYAGGGYEKLHRVYNNIKSQPFYQAGAGVKIALTNRVELETDVKYLKKTKTKDSEVIATMGFGFIASDECDVDVSKVSTKKIPHKVYQNIANTEPTPAVQQVSSKSEPDLFSDEVGYAPKGYKNKVSKKYNILPKGNYIQIASYKVGANASKMLRKLKRQGYKTRVLHKSSLTTILVGPYKSSKISNIFRSIKKSHRDAFYKKL